MLNSSIMVLWLGGLGLQAVLVGVLLSKKLGTKFPVFLAYSVFILASACGLYMLRSLGSLYLYGYWTAEAIGIVLGLGIACEVFRTLILPYTGLQRLAKVAFQVTLVLLVVLGCVVAYTQPSAASSRAASAILVTEEAARIVELGLLAFLFIFSSAFGLHWRQQVFGIAVGLGLIRVVDLLGVTAMSRLGPGALAAINVARMSAFDVSLLIWIGYLLAPERVTGVEEMPKRAQLEQWNRAIMELINQ